MNSTYTQGNPVPGTVSATFRVAEANDVLEIHALLMRGFESYSNRFSPSALKLTPCCIRSSLSDWRVVLLNDKIAGCTMAYQEDDFFTFCYMTVNPDYRQIGLGKAFVAALLAEVRERQLETIKIVLREALTENTRFFTNQGFIRTVSFKSTTHYVYELRLTK
ncbi:GNAT family N-acetyltransferase [Vibrio mediterranei]